MDISNEKKLELALQVDVTGVEFGSIENLAEYTGMDTPEYTDINGIMELGAAAMAKYRVTMLEALIYEVSK